MHVCSCKELEVFNYLSIVSCICCGLSITFWKRSCSRRCFMAHFPIREVSRWNWPYENERWGRSIPSTTFGTTPPIFNDIIYHWTFIPSTVPWNENTFILHEIYVWKAFQFSYQPPLLFVIPYVGALMAEIMLSINLTALTLCQMLLKNPHLRLGPHNASSILWSNNVAHLCMSSLSFIISHH